ncbi:oligosaccharide flippase family protein [Pseudidiomarina sp. 1APP75-32.1]|uniref:Oligosaccharide flippase family protein n=1 Tax=Pseudidiomarina terrestris TaxID=2820060 RepID=A0AAW7QXA7_9GAMM|nr:MULTISPECIES: oligosaccharide flippase family protein [unclassified Pseudidiomarina]MDN7124513.1 oligosaccharide flippase family protein [Pseudidiomarina sp. 1APP75-32.1]MDN7129196.1 oligosaccharide flippase family protein [Pseudidiomarina sp. 1APR75-15]
MKRYIQKIIPKSHVGRSVLVLMSGTAMAQAITAVSMPIVTRLYTPEMIGAISVYLSFFSFWLTLLTWRYESALIVTENIEESHHLFRLGCLIVILMALLAIPVLGSLQYTGVLGFDVLPSWSVLVAFLSLLGFGLYMLYRSWLLRLQETRTISLSAVARSGANALTRVMTGALNFGVSGLFFAEVLGSWFALAAVRKRTLKLLGGDTPTWSMGKMRAAAWKYRKFVQYELPSTLINQLSLALPVPIVGAIYGAEAAGWFGLARLLYAIPNNQIGKSVGDVFQMALGNYLRLGEVAKGERLFNKFALRLGLIGLVPFILAIYAAPPLVPIIFGEAWKEMGIIVKNMAPWMFMALVVGSLSRALSVLQRQELKLIYDLVSLAVVLLAYIYVSLNEMSLDKFVTFLSLSLSLTYLVYFFLIRKSIRHRVVNNY